MHPFKRSIENHQKLRKSRKEHVCCICGGVIKIGENSYSKHVTDLKDKETRWLYWHTGCKQ